MMRRVLSDLFVIEHPRAILSEVLKLFGYHRDARPAESITKAYQLGCRLYRGELGGYQRCDMPYHDFSHAAETFLAMARLLHGAVLDVPRLSSEAIVVGLTAALFHDAGYIRRDADPPGSGAQFHTEHELRSMAFVSQHGKAIGLSGQAMKACRSAIQGTMMTNNVNAMAFRSDLHELLVRMLSASDLLAQLSSSLYLERLLFLYEEDQQVGSPRYRNAAECYHKALTFDERARVRIRDHLPQAEALLVKHFTTRWNVSANLYRISMDRQMQFLAAALSGDDFDPHRDLRRWGSVVTLQKQMTG
jgi:hypothetical protein